jgi:hypothetical protein
MSSEFILDAASLIDFQSCRRKFLLREHRLRKWRPKVLFDACLRRGVVQLSHGTDAPSVASAAKSQFMSVARDPGLDVVGDPYRLARDWCGMLDIVLRWLGQQSIPQLRDLDKKCLSTSILWNFQSWGDDTGTLHRWITVDSWDKEAMSREVHSWRTAGDMVVANAPMVLHVIELGQQRNGHHASAWARAYEHPGSSAFKWKFQKPEDTTWKPVYFIDQRRVNAEEWVEAAKSALAGLTHEVPINVPNESVRRDTLNQIEGEAYQMQALTDAHASWHLQPMSRGACDLYVPCPYQEACYSPETYVDVEKLGLYVKREPSYSTTLKEPANA